MRGPGSWPGVATMVTTIRNRAEFVNANGGLAPPGAQNEVIRTQWRDCAELTELERRRLFGREILNDCAFRN